MSAVVIILCAVSLTASVFLMARFGIKKKESEEFIAEERMYEDVNSKLK